MIQMTGHSDELMKLEGIILESRRYERGINALVRKVLLETYQEMYSEPLNVRPFYRFFKRWIGRSAFYNFLHHRGGVSTDRCLGMLMSAIELRLALGLKASSLSEDDLELLCLLESTYSLKVNLLDKIITTRN